MPILGTHIVHITDTFDANARTKIHGAYIKHASRFDLYAPVDILPAANSITVGTAASEQITNVEHADRLIVAVNFAPPDRKEGTQNNARNDFFCATLNDHVVICGTSNGYEFSYIKPAIKELYRLTATNSRGSQFRSLEILPEHAVRFSLPHARAELIDSGLLKRVEDIDSVVPDKPSQTHVLEIDNFGNVKLVVSPDDRALLHNACDNNRPVLFAFLEAGRELFCAATQHHTALAAPTLFAAPLGTNVIALQSSSRLIDGSDVPVIATIRQNPGDTRPAFATDALRPGTQVRLFAQKTL